MDCPLGSCLPPATAFSLVCWWPHFPHTLSHWSSGRRAVLTLLFDFVAGCSSSTRTLAAFLTVFVSVSLCQVLFVSHTGVVGRAVTALWVEGNPPGWKMECFWTFSVYPGRTVRWWRIPKYMTPFRLGKNGGKVADMESMTRGVGIRESCMKISMEEVSLQRKTRNAYLAIP